MPILRALCCLVWWDRLGAVVSWAATAVGCSLSCFRTGREPCHALFSSLQPLFLLLWSPHHGVSVVLSGAWPGRAALRLCCGWTARCAPGQAATATAAVVARPWDTLYLSERSFRAWRGSLKWVTLPPAELDPEILQFNGVLERSVTVPFPRAHEECWDRCDRSSPVLTVTAWHMNAVQHHYTTCVHCML